jgi:hypothetical protein
MLISAKIIHSVQRQIGDLESQILPVFASSSSPRSSGFTPLKLAAALSFLALPTAALAASNLYVATTGADAGTCAGSASPCKTITYAYAQAVAGSIVNVAPGTYTDNTPGYGIHLNKSGADGAPITLLSTVRGAAIVNESTCAVSGKSYCNGFYVDQNYNVISGFTITGAPDDGIANYGGSHNTYEWNTIYGNGLHDSTIGHYAQGVYEDGNSSYNVFNGNLVYDNGSVKHYDHNFYVMGFYDIITNNVAYNALGYNFQFYNQSASGTNVGYKVYNNVAVGATYGGFVLADNVQGLDFENNIAYGNATFGVGGSTGYGSGVVLKNNMGYNNGSRGDFCPTCTSSTFKYTNTNFAHQNPLFENIAAGNFYLTAASPAINAGVYLPSVTGYENGMDRPTGVNTVGSLPVSP